VSDDHSSLDELADLDEGLLQPSRADEVRAHLAGCAACQDRHQALRDVHDELAVLPPETMPPAVVEKLDRALAGAAVPRSATIVPLAPAAQRRRAQRGWPALAGVAAVVVIIGFFAAVVVGLGHGASSSGGSGTSAGSTTSGADGLSRTPGHFTTTVTPKTFTHGTVPSGISRLVGGKVLALAEPGSSPATANNRPSTSSAVAGVSKALRPLYDSPTKLLNCAAEVAPVKGSVPEAVVFGHYTTAAGKKTPAVFFVFGDRPGRADIDVAGPTCAGLDQTLDFFHDVAIP
jgi:hypothetical protein